MVHSSFAPIHTAGHASRCCSLAITHTYHAGLSRHNRMCPQAGQMRFCCSHMWIWLVNYLHLHLHTSGGCHMVQHEQMAVCAEAGSAAMPHAASTINLESQSIAVPPSVASASPAASTSTVQAGGQASRVPSAQEPAAKGGIAQPKGGTLSLRGQAVQVAQHTLERLQQCFGALLPLQVELPRIET